MTTGEPRRAHLQISGRVQGVWFRDSAKREAERLGVAGWIRNTAAGGVEAEIEGDREALEQLIGWCRKGPPAARVDDVAIEWLDPTGDYAGFVVRR